LRRERVTAGEVLSAVRSAGGREIANAEIVILECNGTLTDILGTSA
jgi:uncharacterized membrane protein YcaP (DUF421 family)